MEWVTKPTFEVMKLGSETVRLTSRVRLTPDMRYEVELTDGRVVDAAQLSQVTDAEIGE